MNRYDGTKLLSMTDLDGERPEIFLCTTNRGGGKTTWFNHKVVDDYLETGCKFGIIYRFKYELAECSGKFFKDIRELFYPDLNMEHKIRCDGSFAELVLNDKTCGYVLPLNSASKLKHYSHYFSDIGQMIFDEFQPEDGVYCSDEVKKFHSLHQTIARGRGQAVRYVPVYMISNSVTLINPYYSAFGINGRLQKDTRFIRGSGWVMEQGFIKDVYNKMKTSAFEKCFVDDDYIDMGKGGKHLLDNENFIIPRPSDAFRYYCTLVYQNKIYSIKIYDNLGIIFCDVGGDVHYKYKVAVDDNSHGDDTRLLKNYKFIEYLRDNYNNGCFRFLNLEAKNCILKLIRYR